MSFFFIPREETSLFNKYIIKTFPLNSICISRAVQKSAIKKKTHFPLVPIEENTYNVWCQTWTPKVYFLIIFLLLTDNIQNLVFATTIYVNGFVFLHYNSIYYYFCILLNFALQPNEVNHEEQCGHTQTTVKSEFPSLHRLKSCLCRLAKQEHLILLAFQNIHRKDETLLTILQQQKSDSQHVTCQNVSLKF